MPYANGTLFLRICTCCGLERYVKEKSRDSGLCRSCATSRRQQGSKKPRHFLPGSLYSEETLARFWSKVNKETSCTCHSWEERCWVWTGRICKVLGYGTFSVDTEPIHTHRFAYQADHGALSSDIFVLHAPPCLLRHCVRHLYAGTPKQNTADAKAMGRLRTGDDHWTHKTPELLSRGENHWKYKKQSIPCGSRNGAHKLVETDIPQIFAMHRNHISIERIASHFYVSSRNISLILKRMAWRHVQIPLDLM